MSANALDSYIGVFCGFEQSSIQDIISQISAFESKFKSKFGLTNDRELKSTTIGKKNFKYGIATFNRDTFDFYKDLFGLIKSLNPNLHIDIISKVEHLLRCTFKGIIFNRKHNVIEPLFYYSLTKFVLVYHTPEVLKSFFNAIDFKSGYNLKKQLIHSLDTIMPVIKNIPRKKREYIAFKQLHDILRDSRLIISSSDTCSFSYHPNFLGLSRLLNELQINNTDVNIIIDNETKTFETATEYNFKSVHQADSKELIQLHICDFLSGFIGRMIFALYNDPNMAEDKLTKIEDVAHIDLASKRIQSPNWFEISQEQYELYLLIHNTLTINHEYYWSTMTLSYFDQAASFYSLLRYFASFDSFEKYKSIDSLKHAEYYNTAAIHELEEHYKEVEKRYGCFLY